MLMLRAEIGKLDANGDTQAGYQERCYYHRFADENGKASIFQPKLGIGLEIRFDAKEWMDL